MNLVEKAKAEGEYRLAGQLARLHGETYPQYGCHFGMRSSRMHAISEYNAGWHEIDAALNGYRED